MVSWWRKKSPETGKFSIFSLILHSKYSNFSSTIVRAFLVFHTISERIIDSLPVRTWAMRHILFWNLSVMIYRRMSGQERQSFANRVFFSNEFSVEIAVLIDTMKKCKMFIPEYFLSGIKVDSKRDVSLIWFSNVPNAFANRFSKMPSTVNLFRKIRLMSR